KKLEITYGHLSNIENNKRKPSRDFIVDFAAATGADPVQLMVDAGYWAPSGIQSNILTRSNAANRSAYIDAMRKRQHVKLEDIIKNNNNVYIKNTRISEEDKNKLLKLIDIIFDERKE